MQAAPAGGGVRRRRVRARWPPAALPGALRGALPAAPAGQGEGSGGEGSVPPGHKRCPRCGDVEPHPRWEWNASSSDGWASYRRACRAERSGVSHFEREYGITGTRRDELAASPGGVRWICLAAPAAHVDHCHETGRVRGVLCFSCNAALGQFKDQPEAIRRAAAYVEGNAWKPTLVAPGVYQLPS
ncbi:endonuclease VII domain-containing protein [Streptomyces sp. NPDC096012]|uniref:endonuclease VII domain-containing protein n=1 Tax=Streptomyces sp. NPDC096012 TaxID=3155684 RepID=UPI003369E7EF